MIKINNVTVLPNNLTASIYPQITANFESKGYIIVQNEEEANVILSVTMKNYGQIEDQTLDNLRKYSQYVDGYGMVRLS